MPIKRGDPKNLANVRSNVYHHYIRVDNPKSLWVEQQGTPFELFEQRRGQGFWRGLRRYLGVWDEMITEFNARVGSS